jgi:hypothetical protein
VSDSDEWTHLPWWVEGYPLARQLDDERWLVAFHLAEGRGRVAVACEQDATLEAY